MNGGVSETLKALANFSPGFALKPWVGGRRSKFFATLKGLRKTSASQLLQSCEEFFETLLTQGFKANPGLALANAFSVKANPGLALANAFGV